MAHELPINIKKAVIKIYIFTLHKYCSLQSTCRLVILLVSHNSSPEQELANFFVKGQMVKYVWLCRPYDLCHNYSTLLSQHGKAALDGSETNGHDCEPINPVYKKRWQSALALGLSNVSIYYCSYYTDEEIEA